MHRRGIRMHASRFWSTAIIVVAALLPATTFAQLTSSVEARTEMFSAGADDRWRGWSTLGASLTHERPRSSLTGSAAIATVSDTFNGVGSLGALISSPALGPLQLSMTGTFARSGGLDITTSDVSARLSASLRFGRWGAWTGIDARRVSGADSIIEQPSPVLGGWRQFGEAIVSLSLSPRRFHVEGSPGSIRQVMRADSTFNDTLGRWERHEHQVTVGDPGRASLIQRWDQAEARLFWSRGRVAFDATLGGRVAPVGMADEIWGALSGLYVLTSRIVIVGGAGTRPGEPAFGSRRRSFATLGVRLLGAPEPPSRPPPEIRPTTSDFRIVPQSSGVYQVRVRVPFARTVELSADFTDWKPLALTRVGTDLWEVTLEIASGMHHVNIRVNGERWAAPPGVPSVEDEFNGTVGLVVVR